MAASYRAPLRLAIAGLGTVGTGVVALLQDRARLLQARCDRALILQAVSARTLGRDRGVNLEGVAWEPDAQALATREDVDVVVELIGGHEPTGPAYRLVERALQEGKHVVTANKALMAHHGAHLAALAEDAGASLLFEAAVAGGTPVIKTMTDGLVANHYHAITGILNGTCNYILSVMERTGRPFDDVLREAQQRGYAEANPGTDIDGIDAAHKLSLLSALAFGTTPDIGACYCEGIRHIRASDMAAAGELGYRIRLIGVTRQDAGSGDIELRVHPALLARHTPMAEVEDVTNAIRIDTDALGPMLIQGPGAGRLPTASAVVANVLDIARANCLPAFIKPASQLTTPRIRPIATISQRYYLRVHVEDHPGVLAALAQMFACHGISVARLVQHERDAAGQVRIVLTTHACREEAMRAALADMEQLSSLRAGPPCLIRIEEGPRD